MPHFCFHVASPFRFESTVMKSKARWMAFACLLGVIIGLPLAQAQTAHYRMEVANDWSAATDPVPVSGTFLHFSWLGGATHSDQVSFWGVGDLASSGIEQMAVNGSTFKLENEVQQAISAGTAGSVIAYHHWFCPTGTSEGSCSDTTVDGVTTKEIDIDAAFPLLSLVTMLGPSPDWFVGLDSVPLRQNGQWLPEVTVDLVTYDGGILDNSDLVFYGSGAAGEARGAILTDPQAPVTQITPTSGQAIGPGPLGTITLTLESISSDFDGDLDVDGADFLKWQRELGDAANLADWEADFGTTTAVAATVAVPEPAAGLLLVVGLGLLAVRHQIRSLAADMSYGMMVVERVKLLGVWNMKALCAVLLLVAPAAAAPPKNVILMIGDGMGPEQVKAAGMYSNGAAGTLNFESFPSQARMMTASANSSVTDSAAGATAIATGVKVNNRVVSVAIPGDGSELPTMLELFKAQGKSTGLVTTTEITHATPATFGAHEADRNNRSQIGQDYLNQTRPNVLFGGTDSGLNATTINNDGNYTLVQNRTELGALDTNSESHVAGLFGRGHLPYEYDHDQGTDNGYDTLPHLSEMTNAALDLLDNDPDGFFLMVEGGRIDHAGHTSNSNQTLKTGRNVFETVEFAVAVQKVLDWANLNDPGLANTLIIVTADHETGNLTVTETDPMAGTLPAAVWRSTGHTGVDVPLVATGANSGLISGVMDNTELLAVVTVPEPSTALLACAALAVLLCCGKSPRWATVFTSSK